MQKRSLALIQALTVCGATVVVACSGGETSQPNQPTPESELDKYTVWPEDLAQQAA